MIGLQHLSQHRLHAGEGELAATACEIAKDDSAASVEHAIELQDAHLAVHVVHGFAHFFDKKNEAVEAGCISLCADVGRDGTDVAADQYAFGMPDDVLRVGGQFVSWHFAQEEIAHEGDSLGCAT